MSSISPLTTMAESLYKSSYAAFFVALADVEQTYLVTNPILAPHARYYVREMRIKAYQQLLESYRSLTLERMSRSFGVSEAFIDRDLSRFIASGRIACTIDKVSGVITTDKLSSQNKTAIYEQFLKQGDLLLSGMLQQSLSCRADPPRHAQTPPCRWIALSPGSRDVVFQVDGMQEVCTFLCGGLKHLCRTADPIEPGRPSQAGFNTVGVVLVFIVQTLSNGVTSQASTSAVPEWVVVSSDNTVQPDSGQYSTRWTVISLASACPARRLWRGHGRVLEGHRLSSPRRMPASITNTHILHGDSCNASGVDSR